MDEREVNSTSLFGERFYVFGIQTDLVAHTGAKKFEWEQFCFEITQPFRISPNKDRQTSAVFILIQHHDFKNLAGLWATNFVWTIEEI